MEHMEAKKDVCPSCGGAEIVRGKQLYQGSVFPYDCREGIPHWSQCHKLIHLIRKSCGTVVRSYLEDPQNFN